MPWTLLKHPTLPQLIPGYKNQKLRKSIIKVGDQRLSKIHGKSKEKGGTETKKLKSLTISPFVRGATPLPKQKDKKKTSHDANVISIVIIIMANILHLRHSVELPQFLVPGFIYYLPLHRTSDSVWSVCYSVGCMWGISIVYMII